MEHTEYLRKLEKRLKELVTNHPTVDEGLEEFNHIAREKREIAEKMVLWHAVHGSKVFDIEML